MPRSFKTRNLNKLNVYSLQRNLICEPHSKAAFCDFSGTKLRWCQQCRKFQQLGDFDDERRTCRERLNRHNVLRKRRRPDSRALFPTKPRRKSKANNAGEGDAAKEDASDDSDNMVLPTSNTRGQSSGAPEHRIGSAAATGSDGTNSTQIVDQPVKPGPLVAIQTREPSFNLLASAAGPLMVNTQANLQYAHPFAAVPKGIESMYNVVDELVLAMADELAPHPQSGGFDESMDQATIQHMPFPFAALLMPTNNAASMPQDPTSLFANANVPCWVPQQQQQQQVVRSTLQTAASAPQPFVGSGLQHQNAPDFELLSIWHEYRSEALENGMTAAWSA